MNPRQCFTLNLIKLLSITLAGQAEFTRKSGSFAHSRPDSTRSSLTNDCNQKCTHTSWLEKLHTEARQLWRMHSRSSSLFLSLTLSLFLFSLLRLGRQETSASLCMFMHAQYVLFLHAAVEVAAAGPGVYFDDDDDVDKGFRKQHVASKRKLWLRAAFSCLARCGLKTRSLSLSHSHHLSLFLFFSFFVSHSLGCIA